LVLVTVAVPALADDLSISGNRDSAVSTSNPSGSTSGNITINSNSSLTINTTGAAVTINSNNSVDNSGNVQNTFAGGGAIGLHILGGTTGGYVQESNGFLNVTGGGAGNYGILLDGTAAFNGTIDIQNGSVLVTHGTDSSSIAIKAPLIGDLKINGVINGIDPGVNGVLITAPVTGTVTTGNVIFLGVYPLSTQYSATAVDPVTGSAVAIGASISGGYLSAGPVDFFDTAASASLQSSSTAPTIVIAPSVAGAAANDIMIGLVAGDTTNPSFSVINRGNVVNKENDPGLSTVGIRIGEHAATAPHTVTLNGGLYNRGVITASSESDNFNASSVSATPTDATGIEIGAGAILINAGSHAGQTSSSSTTNTIVLDAGASTINQFYKGMTVTVNGEERLITDYSGATKTATIGAFRGSPTDFSNAPGASQNFQIKSAAFRNDGQILGYMNGTESGTVTGVLIQPTASVPSFINQGTIKSESYSIRSNASGLTAYGLRDLSGTLSEITNYGTILTQSGFNPTGFSPVKLDDNSQKTIAVDLSAGTQNQTFLNNGTVTGDMLFGQGTNQLTIEGASSGVSGAVHATGNGTLDILVSKKETGGTFLTYSTQARDLSVGKSGQVIFLLTKPPNGQTTIPTVVTASGNVAFAQGSGVSILPGTFLADGVYTLISANGNLHLDDPAGTTAFNVPYLFHATLNTDDNAGLTPNGKTLKMRITRKTTAELGLTGNSAAIYDSLAAAAINDDSYGAALMSLTTAGEVQNALSTAVPDVAGGVRALAVSMTDQATGVIASRQRSLLTAPTGSRDEFRFWAQEFYNNVQQDNTGVQPGFGGAGQGLSVGAEWGKLNTGRYGAGLTFFSSQETELHPRDTKTDGDWAMASLYAAWRADNFFIAPQINAGVGDMQSRRTLLAGNIARFALAKWQSQIAAGGFTSGYILDIGNFQIIPTIAIDGLYLRESDYSESNAGGLGVALNSQNQKSVRGFAGIIGQGNFNYDQGILMPQLVAGYSREFMNDPSTIDGYFESAPGSPFHLVGPTLNASRFVGGMSFGYVLRNWSAGINYDASANSGALAQSATVSLSSRF
jgi:hypothetical protein